MSPAIASDKSAIASDVTSDKSAIASDVASDKSAIASDVASDRKSYRQRHTASLAILLAIRDVAGNVAGNTGVAGDIASIRMGRWRHEESLVTSQAIQGVAGDIAGDKRRRWPSRWRHDTGRHW